MGRSAGGPGLIFGVQLPGALASWPGGSPPGAPASPSPNRTLRVPAYRPPPCPPPPARRACRPGWGSGAPRTQALGAGARQPSLPRSSERAAFLEGERDINQEIKKKKFLHIFKTHVALSEVLFILTKSRGTCPHSGEADGTINHRRRGLPAVRSPQLSLFCLFGFS